MKKKMTKTQLLKTPILIILPITLTKKKLNAESSLRISGMQLPLRFVGMADYWISPIVMIARKQMLPAARAFPLNAFNERLRMLQCKNA